MTLVLQLTLPASLDSIGVATLSHSGSSNFAVWSLDENLVQRELLVNEIGGYAGTVPVNLSTGERITAFEISADGPWAVTLRDVLTVREVPAAATTTGQGDDVLIYFGDATVADIAHTVYSVLCDPVSSASLRSRCASFSGFSLHSTRLPTGLVAEPQGAPQRRASGCRRSVRRAGSDGAESLQCDPPFFLVDHCFESLDKVSGTVAAVPLEPPADRAARPPPQSLHSAGSPPLRRTLGINRRNVGGPRLY